MAVFTFDYCFYFEYVGPDKEQSNLPELGAEGSQIGPGQRESPPQIEPAAPSLGSFTHPTCSQCHRRLLSLCPCSLTTPPPHTHTPTHTTTRLAFKALSKFPTDAQLLCRCCLEPPARCTFHLDTLSSLKLGPYPDCLLHSECCCASDSNCGPNAPLGL